MQIKEESSSSSSDSNTVDSEIEAMGKKAQNNLLGMPKPNVHSRADAEKKAAVVVEKVKAV